MSAGASAADRVTPLTISLVQMDCRLGEPEYNFERAATHVAEAARRGSALVLLPELWSTAYTLDRAPELASSLANTPEDGGWFGRFAALARDNRVWLAGSLLEARAGHFFNCLALYGPDGCLHAVYRKVHLSGSWPKNSTWLRGKKPSSPTPLGARLVLVSATTCVSPNCSAAMHWPVHGCCCCRPNGRTPAAPIGVPCCVPRDREPVLCGSLQSHRYDRQQHLLWRFCTHRSVG